MKLVGPLLDFNAIKRCCILQVGPGLYIGSLYSAAIWSISHNKHKNMTMAGKDVGNKGPPVAEICLKPFLDTRGRMRSAFPNKVSEICVKG